MIGHLILFFFSERGTPALHLNEATWIIDGSNELIVDFLFALVLFLVTFEAGKKNFLIKFELP